MTPQQEQPTSHVHTHRGFSLAELAVVLVITAIISAMIIPRYSNSLALRRVEGAARRIVADLAFAQRHAKATSASQTVRFTVISARYRLEGMSDIDHGPGGYFVLLAKEPYGVSMKSADFGGDNKVVFDVFGVPDNGGSVVIQSGHHVRTITVDADTGKATVQ